MRIARALLPVAVAMAAAAPAGAALPFSSSYVWAQPPAPPVVVAGPFANLPAWLVTTPTPFTLADIPVLTTYRWSQPGTAPAPVVDGQSPWAQ